MLRNTFLITFILSCCFFLAAWQANPTNWKDKIDPDILNEMDSEIEEIEFIIVLKEQADVSGAKQLKGKTAKGQYVFSKLREHALQTQTAIQVMLKNEQRSFQSLSIVNAIHTSGNAALITRLAQLPEVAQINSNPETQLDFPELENNATLRDPSAVEWGIENIGAPQVWDMGYKGQGVVVAGQDTGYDWTHPALQSKYRGWDGNNGDHNYNWHDAIHEISDMARDSMNPCGLNLTSPCDDHNHGTHTMGTMVGEDGDNQIGVAPEAKWIACRNMERGNGTPITYLECYEWFLAPTDIAGENPKPEMAPHVINNSWSCPESEGCNATNWGMMETAVNNLRAAGVVVVVSAGNDGREGCSTVRTPSAIFEGSFTVGSINPNDSISSFSSRGPVTVDGSNRMKPNVSAPGSQVRSSIRFGNYGTSSGTSMAGPHVAGLVALIISAAPELAGEVEIIEDIIEQSGLARNTSQDCGDIDGSNTPNNTYGFGTIQAVEAVNEALRRTATSTTNTLDPQAVQVFPNPTSDHLNFIFEGWEGETQLILYAADGRVILQQNFSLQGQQSIEVSLNTFPKGLYFYRVSNQNQKWQSGRVVKQ